MNIKHAGIITTLMVGSFVLGFRLSQKRLLIILREDSRKRLERMRHRDLYGYVHRRNLK